MRKVKLCKGVHRSNHKNRYDRVIIIKQQTANIAGQHQYYQIYKRAISKSKKSDDTINKSK